MAEPALPPAQYEPADVTFRFLACGAVVVLATILLCMFGVMWLFPTAVQDHRVSSALPVYPSPRLQADTAADLQRFLAQEKSRLGSVGWVDKSRGIVHIPIEEAMRRVAAQGIPDWPQPAAAKP